MGNKSRKFCSAPVVAHLGLSNKKVIPRQPVFGILFSILPRKFWRAQTTTPHRALCLCQLVSSLCLHLSNYVTLKNGKI